jgi:NAD(P)-dependent dehydrogenase (short-subunit alcohol dehydrogenase family)
MVKCADGRRRHGVQMYLTRDVLPAMLTRKSGAPVFVRAAEASEVRASSDVAGCIINVGSVVGVAGNRGQAVYSASKAGLLGFTRSLAQEVASRGIRVNMVVPGFVDTDMTQRMRTCPRCMRRTAGD